MWLRSASARVALMTAESGWLITTYISDRESDESPAVLASCSVMADVLNEETDTASENVNDRISASKSRMKESRSGGV